MSTKEEDKDLFWSKFVDAFGDDATPEELALVRSREPYAQRAPSFVLYHGLLLLHRGLMTRDEFENNIDENEELERRVARKLAAQGPIDLSEARAWREFLARPIGRSATKKELARVRTRAPLRHRGPSVALYEGLVLHHRGQIAEADLEALVEENEKIDRRMAKKRARERRQEG